MVIYIAQVHGEPTVMRITFTVQLQPHQIERAQRAHNRAAVGCNRLLARAIAVR